MICAHCDSPTFRIKPNAEMLTEGGIVKLNTEVYGGPIMSTWFDRPLTLAGRVIVRGEDVMQPQTLLLHIKQITSQLEAGNLLMNVILEELNGNAAGRELCAKDILDFDLYLADATPACTFGVHNEFISSGRLDDLSMCYAGLEALIA